MTASRFAPGGAIVRGDLLRADGKLFVAWPDAGNAMPVCRNNVKRHRSDVRVDGRDVGRSDGLFLIRTARPEAIRATDIVGRCSPAIIAQVERTMRQAALSAAVERMHSVARPEPDRCVRL